MNPELKEKLDILFPFNYYLDLDITKYRPDDQGWFNMEEKLAEWFITETKPELMIEVGSWKGASTIIFSELIIKHALCTKIISIDTWLGGEEHWNILHDFRQNGLPIKLYEQFLANMIFNGIENIVIPMPQTSQISAKLLKSNGVKAELIYIDGSHDENDVLLDLFSYWEILNVGGILFGDDYNIGFDVAQAVNKFSIEKSIILHTFKDCPIFYFRKEN